MKRFVCTLLVTVILFTVCHGETVAESFVFESEPTAEVSSDNGMEVNCRSALLMEASSGKLLFEKNIDEKLPIASVTKVMALLLVMEAIEQGNLSLDDLVTVSENAAGMGGSQAYMEVGEQMTVHDMLKAVVVSSANDGAVALGEHIAGSEEEFVRKMNLRAAELGMTSTEFVNITGLDNTEVHYSTARDVAVMSRELLKHKLIFDYTTIWTDSIRNGKFGLSNTNKLIRFYPGANGLKTGSTSKAKFCISASAERNGMQLIAVILAAPSSDERTNIAKKLFNFGFANYAVYTPAEEEIPDVPVKAGKTPSCKAEYEPSDKILVLKGQETKITRTVNVAHGLCAPIEKGQTIGTITYYLGDKVICEKPITAAEGIARLTFSDIFLRLFVRLTP